MKNILMTLGETAEQIEEALKDSLPNTSNGVTTGNLNNILFWVYGLGGIIAVAVLVYGGIKYIMSQGDPGKTKQASQIIAYAIVGLGVIMLAGAITAFATGLIGGAAQ